MSDYLNPDEDESNDGSRRRAIWGLVVLGCVALIIGSLMLLLGGGSDKKKDDSGLVIPPLTTTSRPTPTASTTPTGTPTTTAQTTPTAAPRTGNPCAGQPTCAVAGDGGVVAAVNAYRAANAKAAVAGSATAPAQTCALHKGAAAFCAAHWIYTTVTSQNGTDCVKGFAGFNPAWLVDPQMTSFSVGWAYVDGAYQCAVTKTLTTD